MKRRLSFWLASLCMLAFAGPAPAQLRIVTYNTANGTFPSGNDASPRAGMDNVLQAIGDEVTNGITRPIDALIFQEHDDPSTTTQEFVNLLNGIYGAGTYAHSTIITLPNFTLNIRQTMVYNTNTLSLIHEKAFGTTGSSAAARQTARFQLRPVGYDATADFYVYNSHYKAGSTSSDQSRRAFEANTIRNDSDALGQGINAIYAGDFNMRSSSETAYQTLLGAGNGQAFDPINAPGTWNNNSSFASIHTQSPHDGSDGLITGGIDDRFDFQLVTGELLDNEGLSYIPGSYHTFGNNGTTFNRAVNSSNNTYPLANSILDDLAHVSDHLPVVADYQLPAKMLVEVGAVTSRVIIGTPVDVPVTVTNVAPVATANGADELDYVVTGIDNVLGNAIGTADPLASGNLHIMSMDTSGLGVAIGRVDVISSSQSVADGEFTHEDDVFTTVVDHSDPSFSSPTDQDLLTIDFGTLPAGSGVIDSAFEIFNLSPINGFNMFTADLDLDSIVGSGDTGVLGSDLASFAGLLADTSNGFLASFDTSTPGTFNATYTLNLSDEDIPGATSQTLTLQLLGEVVGLLTGDLDGDGFVGIADLNIVLGVWNTNVPNGNLLAGDPSGDGFVGIADLNVVLGNWNAGTPPAPGTTVPEPGTLALLGIGTIAVMRGRKRMAC